MGHDTVIRPGSFLAEVVEDTPGGERILHCMQCGSCGGSCPSGQVMEHTPRALFALINGDERDAVLSSNTLWACVSCYFCTTRCPQQILITDIMYALKRKSIAESKYKNNAPALAKAFTTMVESFGRSYEVGLATLYYAFHRPIAMMKMGPMGMALFSRGRMAITPTKIKNVGQLQAIIKKARELSAEEKKH